MPSTLWLTVAFLALLLNSAYLAASAAPTLFYFANVVLHPVLGVGITGAGAGELIAEGVLAVEMGARADDLRLSIHPHPTTSETLMEAAEVFFNTSPHYIARTRG